jgi:hypothetical protein
MLGNGGKLKGRVKLKKIVKPAHSTEQDVAEKVRATGESQQVEILPMADSVRDAHYQMG